MTSLLFHIICFIIPLWPFNFQFLFFSSWIVALNKLETKQNKILGSFFLVVFVGKPTLGTLSQAYLYLKIEQTCSCYMRPDYCPGRLDYPIKTLAVCIWFFFPFRFIAIALSLFQIVSQSYYCVTYHYCFVRLNFQMLYVCYCENI